MKKLQDIVQLKSGLPQSRIVESFNETAPIYYAYGQQELENDLVDIEAGQENPKMIRTEDSVDTLEKGDIVFSLISGRTTIVTASHHGYIYSQNYVKVTPEASVDRRYLVYILNESDHFRKQWASTLQGSIVLKYTVKQLGALELPKMHSVEKQSLIGEIYFEELRLKALRYRVADNEKTIVFDKMKEIE